MARPCGIVTLTTDFGTADAYVAQLHATLLSHQRELRIVDLSHAVPPGRLETTLFLTEAAWPHFPQGAVHLVVVDPGVGGPRSLVAVETPAAFLVGPDTGVLSSGLPGALRPRDAAAAVPLPSGIRAVRIDASPVRAARVAATFHGRDIIAPVAARLATGTPIVELGEPLDRITLAPALAAPVEAGHGEGRIIHIDRFGNAVTNFAAQDAAARFVLHAGNVEIPGPASHYQATGGDRATPAIAIAGSSGYLEIARPNGDAAATLRLQLGDPVRLTPG